MYVCVLYMRVFGYSDVCQPYMSQEHLFCVICLDIDYYSFT